MPATTPQNALGLVRLSDLRAEDLGADGRSANLDAAGQRLHQHGDRLGWRIGRIIVENDLAPGKSAARNASAFKRRRVRLPDGRTELRTVRPGFRLALDLLASGAYDGLIAPDLDRVCRDPRDLEDLIDIVESRRPRIPVESVSGSLKLASDGDVTSARVLVAVANKSSRDTARRVSEARERQALAGQFGGGRRRYGFRADGVTIIPTEAAVVVDCAQRLLQGVPLRALAAELRERKVPTVTGAAWSSATLRDILLRERNAGRMVWQGDIVATAPWEPIISPEVHDAVVAMLRDPDRRQGTGNAARWLGSGIYRCGVCEPRLVTLTAGKAGGQAVYKCRAADHLGRAARHVDSFISELIVARLSQDDAADLLAEPAPTVDAPALRAEAKGIRNRLDVMAGDEALGLKTRSQVIAATRKGKARIAEIDQQLTPQMVSSPLKDLIEADDVEAEWNRLPLANRRVVVDALIVVTILPAARRGPGFDESSVRVEWR